jgi:hypothetical protein
MEGGQVMLEGRPYLDRLRVVQTPFFSVLLHRIHGPDPGRDAHDHPWWFASLILSGSYDERVWVTAGGKQSIGDGHASHRRRFSLHSMPLDRAHRITDVHGVLWTLVLTGRRGPTWRFWTTEGPVDWKDYGKEGEAPDDGLWPG